MSKLVEHRPLGVRLATAKRGVGIGVIVIAFCECGEVASTNGATFVAQRWQGEVSGSPSLDWPGHFHTSNPWTLPYMHDCSSKAG